LRLEFFRNLLRYPAKFEKENEIFDMVNVGWFALPLIRTQVKPVDAYRISLKDLMRCGMQST